MKNQKITALLLAMTMALTVFTGCSNNANKQSEESKSSESEQVQTSESTQVQSSEEVNLFEEEVHLVYVLPQATATIDGLDAVEEALNEITKEKINATIEFEMIPLGEYTNKMNMKFTAGEEFDLCFTGAWNPYLSAVTQGAYAELTEDVLNTYAPEYVAQLNPAAWDAVTVDGKIYGCPIEQIYVRQSGVYFNTELAKKYNFDYTAVKTLDDIDAFLKAVKENEKKADVQPYYSGTTDWTNYVSYFGWDAIVGATVPGVVYAAEDTPKVINQFETEEFKAFCEKMQEWYDAGYIAEDVVTGGTTQNGKTKVIWSLAAKKPGGDVTESKAQGLEVESVALGDACLTTSAINATITAVSATSKNVERAVAFINLLNTDKEVLNLICHGIEGVDYTFVDKENEVIQSTGKYPGIYSFLVGCVFNEYYTDASQVGTWEETAEINANAKGSCILGFTFNSEPVATQIAQCTAVTGEYLPAITCGLISAEEGIPVMLEALKQAGVDDIIAEMQSQIDAWMATK